MDNSTKNQVFRKNIDCQIENINFFTRKRNELKNLRTHSDSLLNSLMDTISERIKLITRHHYLLLILSIGMISCGSLTKVTTLPQDHLYCGTEESLELKHTSSFSAKDILFVKRKNLRALNGDIGFKAEALFPYELRDYFAKLYVVDKESGEFKFYVKRGDKDKSVKFNLLNKVNAEAYLELWNDSVFVASDPIDIEYINCINNDNCVADGYPYSRTFKIGSIPDYLEEVLLKGINDVVDTIVITYDISEMHDFMNNYLPHDSLITSIEYNFKFLYDLYNEQTGDHYIFEEDLNNPDISWTHEFKENHYLAYTFVKGGNQKIVFNSKFEYGTEEHKSVYSFKRVNMHELVHFAKNTNHATFGGDDLMRASMGKQSKFIWSHPTQLRYARACLTDLLNQAHHGKIE